VQPDIRAAALELILAWRAGKAPAEPPAPERLRQYDRNSRGRVVSTMPWTNTEYWLMTHEPDLDDFLTRGFVGG
jgi:hypothetical protein